MPMIKNYNLADSGIIPVEVTDEILQGVIKNSAVLGNFRRLPNMTSASQSMSVLDALPVAYWQNSDTAIKNTTELKWKNKFIYAEEIAVIVPISEASLADSKVDVWGEVKPRLIEAFHKKIDDAIITGRDKPVHFRDSLVATLLKNNFAVDFVSNDLYKTISNAMGKVELSGYMPNKLLGSVKIKQAFREMLDANKLPINGTEVNALPKSYVDNGSWDDTKGLAIVGDFNEAVYSIRQEIEFKLFTEGVVQDPSTGKIIYNLMQQDMIALRATMRLGWELPNPINALQPDESLRFPFALIKPASGFSDYTNVDITFTVQTGKLGATKLANAEINFAGVLYKSVSSTGVATAKGRTGLTYPYSVRLDGYKTVYGEYTVTGSDDAVTIDMVAVKEDKNPADT